MRHTSGMNVEMGSERRDRMHGSISHMGWFPQVGKMSSFGSTIGAPSIYVFITIVYLFCFLFLWLSMILSPFAMRICVSTVWLCPCSFVQLSINILPVIEGEIQNMDKPTISTVHIIPYTSTTISIALCRCHCNTSYYSSMEAKKQLSISLSCLIARL